MKVDAISTLRGLVRRHVWILLLISVHLPLVIPYLMHLWQQTHYQFFPFAIAAFICLFAARRSQDPERWTLICRLVLVFDVCCLAAGYFLFSPWTVAVGLVAVLTAWCLACRDAGYSRSLGYLGLLPLLVIRLPLSSDLDVIHWLQRITTSISSRTLNRLGLLHVREGNQIEFPGKKFLVEEACSGVQSLFTILFLAALVICLKRRSIVHGVALLASAVMYAGIMNVIRVVTIAAGWDVYAIDLSIGWPHDVLGYLCLSVAALMLMSTDAFLGFLTDPVPDTKRPGPVGIYRNPLIKAWNTVMAVVPSAMPRSTHRSDAKPSRKSGKAPSKQPAKAPEAEAMPSAEQRVYPTGAALIRPANWFHFTLGLAESWIFSRRYGGFAAGLPFLATGIGGVLLIWWLQHASDDPVLAAYETAFNVATQKADVVRQETYLRALSGLRPRDPEYRFRLGQFLVAQGRTNEGLTQITALAAEPNLGSAEARKWLVRQALGEKPLVPMNAEEIELQLRRILLHVPTDAEAHQLLAKQYINRKEWKLAEQHLTVAAEENPELNLALAKLKRVLDRNPDDVRSCAMKAIAALAKHLEQNRLDAGVRIALAEAQMVAMQDAEARETLVSGLSQKDDPKLRTALCDFDLMQLERRLQQSMLNRDFGVQEAVNALHLDPANVAGVRMLTRLHSLGAKIPEKSVHESLTHWQTWVHEHPDDASSRMLLSQLLFITGDPVRSAEILRPAVNQRPEQALTLARLLLQTDQEAEGRAMFETLITESQATLLKTPGDVTSAVIQAECLLSLGRSEDARTFLMSLAADPATDVIPSDPGLAILFGRASLESYDRMTGRDDLKTLPDSEPAELVDTGADVQTLLTLLTDALRCPATTTQSIDRLARLSLSSHPAAARAEDVLRQMRVQGSLGVQALNMLGMHALLLQRFDVAQKHLEQANVFAEGNNPMVLNNLATALIRGGKGENERALELVNAALVILKNNPDVLSTRGEVYVAMQHWNEAIADLTGSLNVGRNTAEIHRLLEKAYTGLADAPMAEEHRRKAEEIESAQASG